MSGVKERLVITNPQVALEPDHLDGHAPRSSPSVSTHVRKEGFTPPLHHDGRIGFGRSPAR